MTVTNIPESWHRCTLGEITTEENERIGTRLNPIILSCTKYQGLVPSDLFFAKRRVYSENLSNYKLTKRGWFAYATNHLNEGSIGLQGNYDCAGVSPMYTVFSVSEDVDPNYLFRVLKSKPLLNQYKNLDQATVDRRGSIRYKDFSRISIDLPPLSEQREITFVLDRIDRSIALTEAHIAKLKKAKAGLLHDLLTLGIDENGELRNPIHHLEQFQDSPLGKIPADWDVLTIEELLNGKPKNGYSPKEVNEWTGKLMLGLGCLTYEGFNPCQLKNAPAKDPKTDAALLKDGDFLISRSNTRELVALVGIYSDLETPTIYPDLMMRLLPNQRVSNSLLEILMRHDPIRRQLTSSAQGTSESMVKINSTTVLETVAVIPPTEEQSRILDEINKLDKRVQVRKARLKKLKYLKEGLMTDLLTGRVRVKVESSAEG